MEFVSYPSIANVVDLEFIQRIQKEIPNDKQWIVTEKCHGSNIQILVTSNPEDGIKLGSRNQYVDDFRGAFLNIAKSMETKLRKIVLDEKVEYLRFFGELYSGQKKLVAKQLPYCKEVKIGIFDVAYPNKEFMNWKLLEKYLLSYNIHHFPVLFEGTLKDALVFAADHVADLSTIADGTLGTPIREGIVLKPIEYQVLSSGSRVILKHKSPDFTETKIKLTSEQLHSWYDLIVIIEEFINEARVASLLSKYPKPEELSLDFLTSEFILDIHKELLPLTPEKLKSFVIKELPDKINNKVNYLIQKGLSELKEI